MTDLIAEDTAPSPANLSNIERLRLQLVACLSELSAEELAYALTPEGQRAAISSVLA